MPRGQGALVRRQLPSLHSENSYENSLKVAYYLFSKTFESIIIHDRPDVLSVKRTRYYDIIPSKIDMYRYFKVTHPYL